MNFMLKRIWLRQAKDLEITKRNAKSYQFTNCIKY